MAGLTPTGLVVKNQDEILSDLQEEAISQFGSGAGVSRDNVLGRVLGILSEPLADVWELTQAVHSNFNPSTATSRGLDNIVAFGNLKRLGASQSTALLVAYGDRDTVIDEGSYLSSKATAFSWITSEKLVLDTSNVTEFVISPIVVEKNKEYSVTYGTSTTVYKSNDNDSTDNIVNNLYNSLAGNTRLIVTKEGDSVYVKSRNYASVYDVAVSQNMVIKKVGKIVKAHSEEYGAIYQPPGSIDTITTPVTGWDSIWNPEESVNGRERETDTQLRRRFSNTKELNARGTYNALRSNLMSVKGVESVDIYENDLNYANEQGLPPKSFSAIVLGGLSDDIAHTIWECKPAGILSHGNTTVTIKDASGRGRDIAFSRPTFVPIYVEMTITELEKGAINNNYEESINKALADHINQLTVGEDVSYSRLYTPINSVGGFEVLDLKVGRDPNKKGTTTVPINYDEKASIVYANITINKKVK